jgi:hypothetical protein
MGYRSVALRKNWLILFLFLIYFARPAHALAKPVTLAYQTPTLSSNLPIFAAVELGIFASENLDVKTVFHPGWPHCDGCPDRRERRLREGRGDSSRTAIAQGAPVVIAGGFQPYVDYSLLGSKKVNNLNDLRVRWWE